MNPLTSPATTPATSPEARRTNTPYNTAQLFAPVAPVAVAYQNNPYNTTGWEAPRVAK